MLGFDIQQFVAQLLCHLACMCQYLLPCRLFVCLFESSYPLDERY